MDTFKLRKIFIFWLHCSNNNWRDINVNNFTIPIVHHIFRHNCTYESTCMRRNYLESLINQQKQMRWSKLRKEQFWNHKRSKLTGSECHDSTKNILLIGLLSWNLFISFKEHFRSILKATHILSTMHPTSQWLSCICVYVYDSQFFFSFVPTLSIPFGQIAGCSSFLCSFFFFFSFMIV